MYLIQCIRPTAHEKIGNRTGPKVVFDSKVKFGIVFFVCLFAVPFFSNGGQNKLFMAGSSGLEG